MVYLHLFYNKLNVISGTEADTNTDANLCVKRIQWTRAERETKGEESGLKAE